MIAKQHMDNSWSPLKDECATTRNPDRGAWMEQVGRAATLENWGYLHPCRHVLHDRDKKFCASFRSAFASGGVKTIPLPAKSPNLNVFAERWVRSVKQECLSKVILFGESFIGAGSGRV